MISNRTKLLFERSEFDFVRLCFIQASLNFKHSETFTNEKEL